MPTHKQKRNSTRSEGVKYTHKMYTAIFCKNSGNPNLISIFLNLVVYFVLFYCPILRSSFRLPFYLIRSSLLYTVDDYLIFVVENILVCNHTHCIYFYSYTYFNYTGNSFWTLSNETIGALTRILCWLAFL